MIEIAGVDLEAEHRDLRDISCARSGRSVASYVEQALLSSLEDFIDAHDADVIMANIKAGREVTCSLDDVERDLGLRDEDGSSGKSSCRLLMKAQPALCGPCHDLRA